MSYDNLSSVSQNVLKFYQQLTGEERRITVILDDFHFCRSRVIGLGMTENRMFTKLSYDIR
jgi:ATP/maltotriose-dependent transcriptional regulator MalT